MKRYESASIEERQLAKQEGRVVRRGYVDWILPTVAEQEAMRSVVESGNVVEESSAPMTIYEEVDVDPEEHRRLSEELVDED